MRRVWVIVLVFIFIVSVLIAGSAGYMYLSGTEQKDGKLSGAEENQIAEEGNVTTGSKSNIQTEIMTEVIRNQIKTVRNGSERRYINKYESHNEKPNWILEEGDVSLEDPETAIYEVTRYPNAEPTTEHLNNSWEIYNRTYEAAERNGWFEYQKAVEQGYVDFRSGVGRSHHYNASYYLDGEVLNPEKPESLIYYEDPENESKKILVGVMYQNMKREGEQLGGPLTVWHYHPIRSESGLRRLNDVMSQQTRYDTYEEMINEAYKKVPEGRLNRTGEMIHVWFVRHPEGPFGTTMSVPASSLKNQEKMSKQEFTNRVMQVYGNRLKQGEDQ